MEKREPTTEEQEEDLLKRKISHTGNRTRASRVKAEYPSH